MVKKGVIGLVEGTGWNGFIELNRMAFSDRLPRNNESRAIAIAMKLIRKHYPGIEWVISFADGAQCGDGTIYRASGFVLTAVKPNGTLRINPSTGQPMQAMAAFHADEPDTLKAGISFKASSSAHLFHQPRRTPAPNSTNPAIQQD